MRFKSLSMNFIWIPFLLVCFTCAYGQEQKTGLNDSTKTILTELNKYIHPISGSEPSLSDTDLAPFDCLAGTKIIGLGEATHGTKEFFQMKHRLFKYFVEKHSYKIFGFEADMGECIYIDRFICKGTGTIDEAMTKMHFWTWRTEEVKDLILWMKKYNENKAPAAQIHFLGFDCQSITYVHDIITEYFSKNNILQNKYPERILDEINGITYDKFQKLSQTEIDLYKTKCDSVTSFIDENKGRIIVKEEDRFEFEQMKRLMVQAKQVFDVATKKSYLRDKYMADNAVWFSNLYGNNTKIVLWAHNGHVAKNPLYSGIHGSMGNNLSKTMGTQYKVIGFSFNYGSFQAVGMDAKTRKYQSLSIHKITSMPLEKSSNYLFSFASPKNFVLFTEEAGNSPILSGWLNKLRLFFSAGAIYCAELNNIYYYNHNLAAYFDALIHFHDTNAAIAYKKASN